MTTEQTAQQLELVAQILRTGHPFEVRHDTSDEWLASLGVNPAQAILQNWHLRPVLATPPDGRPIINPRGLSACQVGAGYRLLVAEDEFNPDAEVFWDGTWRKTANSRSYAHQENYRLPISVPWPEPEKPDPYSELKAAHAAGKVIQILNHQNRYVDADPTWTSPVEYYRIKPEAPPFQPSDQAQLPPPPPGMSWHREDGWKAEDLPQGYRPLVAGENWLAGDEIRRSGRTHWEVAGTPGDIIDDPVSKKTSPFRTTRPLTFEHGGKTWTYHRPGYPMPCDGGSLIWVLYDEGTHSLNSYCANDYVWGRVIGWRYAETQTTTVPLGPEDVPLGSVIRGAGEAKDPDNKDWCLITSCSRTGIRYWRQSDSDPEPISWLTLKTHGAQINRSLSKGQWNPDAWEPCHKKYDC